MPPFGVDGSDDNTFVENTANGNLRFGFFTQCTSEMNTFRENDGESNGDWDALDDSNGMVRGCLGGGTGAGNDWVDNVFGSCSGLPDACP